MPSQRKKPGPKPRTPPPKRRGHPGGPNKGIDNQKRTMVESLCAFGLRESDIAEVMAISVDTLQRHYKKELATGHLKANVKVAQNLFRMAMGNDSKALGAAIFWLRTRARWKMAEDEQQPRQNVINVLAIAAEKLSVPELKAMAALYRKMGARLPHEQEEEDEGGPIIEGGFSIEE